MASPDLIVEVVGPDRFFSRLDEVIALHLTCVEDNELLSLVKPVTQESVAAYWEQKSKAIRANDGALTAIFAELDGRLAGLVLLNHERDFNQFHIGFVNKLIVWPKLRKQGIGTALMKALEALATSKGLPLLYLNTQKGDEAEKLYLKLGYKLAGVLPDYALLPDGTSVDISYLYKRI